MLFDKKLAVDILEIIARFPVGFLLCETPDHVPEGEFIEIIPEEMFESQNFTRMLAHLYVMSHSGLIFPQFNLSTLQEVYEIYSKTRMNRNDNFSIRTDFCNHIFPSYLMHFSPTVQGYEFLEKHR